MIARQSQRTGAVCYPCPQVMMAHDKLVGETPQTTFLEGDLRAAELILDRIEGKAIAKVEQTFNDVTPGARISFRKGNVTELPKPKDEEGGKATG